MKPNFSFQKVFTAACLGMLLFGVVIISLGSILPSITDKYGLDTLEAGTLASILPVGILLGSLVFGPIVDRYSYRNLLLFCSVLIVLGLQGLAFASQLWILQLSFLCIGFGGGALNGGTSALVADISEDRPGQRSANLSLLGVFFGIGALGVPTLMALLSSQFSFESILQGIGLAILLPIIYFLLISYPPPKQKQSRPLIETLAMVRDRNLLLLGMFLFFQSAMEGIINNWTTSFLQDRSQLDAADALFALSTFVLSLTLARLVLAGVLRLLSPLIVLLISIGLLLLGSVLLMISTAPFSYFGGLILLGLGAAAGFPVILAYVGELYSELRGTAFSFVFFIALIGNTLVNYLMGLVANYYGIEIFPWVLIICITFLLLIAVWRLPALTRRNS